MPVEDGKQKPGVRKVSVRIEFYANLREKYGKYVDVECDGTLENAFYSAAKMLGEEFLSEIFDDEGNFRKDRIILVNGRNVKDEIVSRVEDGTRISVFPPVAGG